MAVKRHLTHARMLCRTVLSAILPCDRGQSCHARDSGGVWRAGHAWHLFFFNLHRVRSNLKSGASSEDKFAQAFGTIIPRRIPESSSWWKVVFDSLLVCSYSLARARVARRHRAETSLPSPTTLNKDGIARNAARSCLGNRVCMRRGVTGSRADLLLCAFSLSVLLLLLRPAPLTSPCHTSMSHRS